ncbi:MAG TPA: hypothetical protein VF630_14250 [Hymenobacter sp.]|jgi:hypothetical protein
MRLPFLIRSLAILLLCGAHAFVARASHVLGTDLSYDYIGTAANPYQYRVTARIFRDVSSLVTDNNVELTCGKDECGRALLGSFITNLVRISSVPMSNSCAIGGGAGGGSMYEVITFEGTVQLPPARWTLSINFENRAFEVLNITQSGTQSIYVQALLDNSTGLVNSSPRFTNTRLFQVAGVQAQHYSVNAFDSEGDSLTYQLVQPLAKPAFSAACAAPVTGVIAPHFQLNAATGELATVSFGAVQQGRYALAAQVNEYRRVNGSWQQIGSITRDVTYNVVAGTNQVPAFTRVAPTGTPGTQLLGQIIPVNPGQAVSLTLTATDPDAGQALILGSDVAGMVPGTVFQSVGNGQGIFTWQVPTTLPVGRYAFTVAATDNACPVYGSGVVTLTFLVTRQALGARSGQSLAQLPHPMPFRDEVRFQLAGSSQQTVVIVDELGRTVQQLTTSPDGRVVWRPAANVSAGLYFARNLSGTQRTRLAYSGR